MEKRNVTLLVINCNEHDGNDFTASGNKIESLSTDLVFCTTCSELLKDRLCLTYSIKKRSNFYEKELAEMLNKQFEEAIADRNKGFFGRIKAAFFTLFF